MDSNTVIHILIDIIIIGFLFYIYKANKSFFLVSILILLLIIFIIPEFLLPSYVWEMLLTK